LTSAGGAAGQLGPTIGADQVTGVALQDGWEDIVEADRALKQAGQVASGVGRGGNTRHTGTGAHRIVHDCIGYGRNSIGLT